MNAGLRLLEIWLYICKRERLRFVLSESEEKTRELEQIKIKHEEQKQDEEKKPKCRVLL